MIVGIVESGQARIALLVRGTSGREETIDAVIDTGYSAAMSLPPDEIAALGLVWQNIESAFLADGSEVLFDVYEAQIIWDGAIRAITIDEADSEPVIGMSLLRGFELKMQVRDGGKVTIKRLSSK